MNKHKEEIEHLVLKGWKAINGNSQSERQLDALFMKVNNADTPPCCEGPRRDFFNKIESFYSSINPNYQKPIIMSSQTGDFQLKEKMKLYTPSIETHLTPANCTDELAVETLAQNKGRINCFSRYPKDWEKRVEEFKTRAEKEKAAASKAASAEKASATDTKAEKEKAAGK